MMTEKSEIWNFPAVPGTCVKPEHKCLAMEGAVLAADPLQHPAGGDQTLCYNHSGIRRPFLVIRSKQSVR